MAVCSLSTLETDACDNGFKAAAENPALATALTLQLLYEISGSSSTLAELQTSACANGLMSLAQNPTNAMAVQLELLCTISGGD